jgi:hypothetical protein
VKNPSFHQTKARPNAPRGVHTETIPLTSTPAVRAAAYPECSRLYGGRKWRTTVTSPADDLVTLHPDCSAATGGCDCTVSRDGGVNDTTSYVVNGMNIIAGGVTYPFCIPTSNVMQYQEAGSSPQLPQGDLGRR